MMVRVTILQKLPVLQELEWYPTLTARETVLQSKREREKRAETLLYSWTGMGSMTQPTFHVCWRSWRKAMTWWSVLVKPGHKPALGVAWLTGFITFWPPT